MDPKKAKAIFLDAVENCTPDEWPAYLDEACGGDTNLRNGVELLLEAHQQDVDLVEQGREAWKDALPTIDRSLAEKPGTLVGPYKLLEQIGEGGMGLVYMARQQKPVKRNVALKVIKPGMDSKQVIVRFEAERQALALMDHPNIARVLDAGSTESGRPFFVMDLVRGIPITEYCDRNRVSTRERLGLFVSICYAVQHAHQKGIIHRDLKPTNVLVTMHDGAPIPKVIDFGIAKATRGQLTEETLVTNFSQMIGTPLYMSPEQAEMSDLDVDTRSDVYSLGVLLYELLTGTTPFDREKFKDVSFDELRRIIREEEPPRPSTRLSTLDASLSTVAERRQTDGRTLSRQVSGELDWIVMKALEKDRTRRYETALDLAKDVTRYLSDEAVEACPPSVVYRISKFARRNRTVFIASTAVALALVVGAAVSIGQAIRATTAEGLARERLSVVDEQRRLAKQQQQVAERQKDLAQRQKSLAQQQEAEAVRQRDTATGNLYLAQMRLAQQDWDADQTVRLHDALDAQIPAAGRPDFRAWEWYYFLTRLHGDLRTFRGHNSNVKYIEWSPDGARIASAGSIEGKVKIWDVNTGQESLTLEGPGGRSGAVDWHPDSQRVAVTSGDPTVVRICETETGQEVLRLDAKDDIVSAVAWHPDGSLLAVGYGDGSMVVWEVEKGRQATVLTGHTDYVSWLAFSPDGKQLASVAWDATLKVWDVANSTELLSRKKQTTEMHLFQSVAFSPDGKYLATGDRDRVVTVWDPKTGEEIRVLRGHTDAVYSVAFSPDGRWLASGSHDHTAKIWDAATGQLIRTLRGHTERVYRVAWSPDGRRLASSSRGAKIKIWDTEVEPGGRTFGDHGGSAQSLAWSPDATRIVSGSLDGSVKTWNTTSGKEVLKLFEGQGEVHAVCFHPDGRQVAFSWEKTVKVVDTQRGEEVRTLQGHPSPVHAVAFSPDGQYLASASGEIDQFNQTVNVWEAATGQLVRTLRGDPALVNSIAWAPDSRRLASAGYAGSRGNDDEYRNYDALIVQVIWDVSTGQSTPLPSLPQSYVHSRSLSFSPDGRHLASTAAKSIWIFNTVSGETDLAITGHTGKVYAVSWSPDGRRLASAGQDGTVKIWESSTGQEIITLDDHPGAHHGLTFSPDGQRLASASDDGTIRVWDASPGYRLAQSPMFHHGRAYDRAERLVFQGQNQEAIDALRILLDEAPEMLECRNKLVQCYRKRGYIRRRAGEYDRAIADYEKAIRLAPRDPQLYFFRGLAYAIKGDFDLAIADYSEAIRLNPRYAPACNGCAWLLATCPDPAMLDLKRAVELAGKAVELSPGEGSYLNTLGVAQYRAGSWKKAVEALDKSVELRSGGDSYDWLFLAMAHWQLGEKVKARPWYDKAVKWMDAKQSDDEELRRFRLEAAELLGITEEVQPQRHSETTEPDETNKTESNGQEKENGKAGENEPPGP